MKPKQIWMIFGLEMLCFNILGAHQPITLDSLASQPVVETSKDDARLFDTPVNAHIFDSDAVLHGPVESIPELLRYAPGMHITRYSNGVWGLGIRGMTSRLFGRVGFTVDEQNAQNSIFAGLFGNVHDVIPEDVSSVEVVYGPGGSLWGLNAVNGMVNVVTKSAFETEGSIANFRLGTEEREFRTRYGWALDENTSARVYGKLGYRKAGASPVFEDDWIQLHGGFRLDRRLSPNDLLTISLDANQSDLGFARLLVDETTGFDQIIDKDEVTTNAVLKLRWRHDGGGRLAGNVQTWFSRTHADSAYAEYRLDISGIDLRGRYRMSDQLSVIFTAGGTLEKPGWFDHPYITFFEDSEGWESTAYAGTEVQIALVPNRLSLDMGLNLRFTSARSETHLLPSLRLIYSPQERMRFWVAYMEATRTIPNLTQAIQGVFLGFAQTPTVEIPTPFGLVPVSHQLNLSTVDPEMEGEETKSIELGYRHQLSQRQSFRMQLFYTSYDNIVDATIEDFELRLMAARPYSLGNFEIQNMLEGHAFGLDLSYELTFDDATKLGVTYAYIQDDFDVFLIPRTAEEAMVLAAVERRVSENTAPHVGTVWWTQVWREGWRTDLGLRYSAPFGRDNYRRSGQFQADLRLSWTIREGMNFSLVGRNLLDATTDQTQLKEAIGLGTEIRREAFFELRIEF